MVDPIFCFIPFVLSSIKPSMFRRVLKAWFSKSTWFFLNVNERCQDQSKKPFFSSKPLYCLDVSPTEVKSYRKKTKRCHKTYRCLPVRLRLHIFKAGNCWAFTERFFYGFANISTALYTEEPTDISFELTEEIEIAFYFPKSPLRKPQY